MASDGAPDGAPAASPAEVDVSVPAERAPGAVGAEGVPEGASRGPSEPAAGSGAAARNAEEAAGCLARWTLTYLNPLLAVGSKRPLVQEDLGDAAEEDLAETLMPIFDGHWAEARARAAAAGRAHQPSLPWALARTVGYAELVFSGLLTVMYTVLSFVPPMMLKLIVSHLEGTAVQEQGTLVVAALLMLVSPVLGSLFQAQQQIITTRVGIKMRTVLIVKAYRKGMSLSALGKRGAGVGVITNVMSNDTQAVSRFMMFLHITWTAPIIVGVALYLIYQEVGGATFAGAGFLVALAPVNVVLFSKLGKLRRAVLQQSDRRVQLATEVLTGIKLLKYQGWTAAFENLIAETRGVELRHLKAAAYLAAVGFSFVLLSAPILMPVVVFAVFSASGGELSASKAFTSLALFNIMRFPFAFMPMGMLQYIQTKVAITRVRRLLMRSELPPRDSSPVEGKPVALVDATFDWNKPSDNLADSESLEAKRRGGRGGRGKKTSSGNNDPTADKPAAAAGAAGATEEGRAEHEGKLQNISVEIEAGSLVAVVGEVASGKSSLVSAMLGEMPRVSGKSGLTGSVAYVNQSPFIMNATLRDNILFGRKYEGNEELYRQSIEVSCLKDDLKLFERGELEEIGERGINLSGGQKARVALARAVMADADVVLLDDPLSAVDAHVGKAIFDNCVSGQLQDKTVVMVTHAEHVLGRCDKIIIMHEGRVKAQGTLEELRAGGHDVGVLTDGEHKDSSEGEDGTAAGSVEKSVSKARAASVAEAPATKKDKKGSGNLIEDEERSTGSIGLQVYLHYFKACGVYKGLFMITLNILMRATTVGAPFWLAEWSTQAVNALPAGLTDEENRRNLNIYALISLSGVVLVLFRAITIANMRISASQKLHDGLIRNILRAPMNWFDVTPLGRITNRISRDFDRIDQELPPTMSQLLGTMTTVAGALAAMTISTKGIFLVVLVPVMYSYYVTQKFFRKSSTEVQRLESVSRSPLFATFTESIVGAAEIRSFNLVATRSQQNVHAVNQNTVALQLQQFASQWLAVRLDAIGAVAAAFIAFVAIIGGTDFVPAGFVAVGLSFSLDVTMNLKHAVRMYATAELQMNAVERVRYYTEKVASEAAEHIPAALPDAEWPKHGAIDISDLNVRYRDGPLVVKDLAFSAKPTEKIGVVGRTGAGKSTILSVLLRLIEPEAGSKIMIDGVDACSLGLTDLRRRVAMIPQDPVLFSSSLRFNLDPFGESSDDDILEALKHAQLDLGLDATVEEGGKNFSQGQRQLICIARALIRKPKILFIDEATASVDEENDKKIQEMIRREFAQTTVITIAHRLHTLRDYDKILVLDKGRKAEFGPPDELLAMEGGIFKSMVEASQVSRGGGSASPTAAAASE